jgi:hypothetical protein
MKSLQIEINHDIKEKLPETYRILESSKLTVHPFVYKVVLTGSRGPAGKYRNDSDVDLSLLVESSRLKIEEDEEKILNEILNVTLQAWESPVELDTIAIFAINSCGLNCFDCKTYEDRICKEKGIDCMGLYKTQKGFTGYVPKVGIDIQKVYPMITVWEREKSI